MTQRMEFGWMLEDGRYLCDGCNVRDGHEHRCHHGDGAWQDGRTCDCVGCATTVDFVGWVASQDV